MDQKLKAVLVGLCMVLVIGGAYLLYDKLADSMEVQQLATQPTQTEPQSTQPVPQETEEAQAESEAIPNITVYDTEGNPVKISDFRGKPVILNFWASWCGVCKSEMPNFEQAYEKYGQQVHFLMINITDGYQETKGKAAAFIAQEGYRFPVYYDMGAVGSDVYGIYSLPTTLFLDAEGRPVAYATGALSEANLEKGIAMLRGSN